MNIRKHNVHEKHMTAEVCEPFMLSASFTALQGECVEMTVYHKTNKWFIDCKTQRDA
jgi:DNA-binding CsgD family transcriptional regulator